jgi:hypothetical protein
MIILHGDDLNKWNYSPKQNRMVLEYCGYNIFHTQISCIIDVLTCDLKKGYNSIVEY